MNLRARSLLVLTAAALPFVLASACVTRLDGVCDVNNACTGDPDGSVKDGGGDALVPPGCASGKDPKDDPNCVSDGKGVFVKAGASGGDGTRGKPFGTIGEGLAKAAGRAVFVCEGTYAEALELSGAVALYGGFDCATFAHAGKKSTLASPKALAVTVKPGAAVVLQDFVVRAADGSTPGESSVAVFANAAQSVQIARSELTAGAGAAGAMGQAGAAGEAGDVGKAPVGNAGGDPGVRTCNDGTKSVGGAGGAVNAGPTFAPGTDGTSTPANYMEANGAFTGAGGSAYDGNPATSGRAGKNGAPGSTLGAPADIDGTLDGAGWIASSGKAGGTGFPGQGGGGGGAGGSDGSGGPGGGGGSGGCGGGSGAGGQGGGSSIAIVAFQSEVKLTDTKLVSGVPGAGGQGGTGGAGGGGGGVGSVTGATGGGGGNGAGGNGGGGGTGGSSFGVLYKGKAPMISGAAVTDAPTASYHTGAAVADNGGPPGDPGPAGKIGAHDGNPGVAGAKGRAGNAAAVREVK